MSTVALIIPVWNGQQHLRAQLPALISQQQRPDRIVIIDSSSRDASAVVAREHGCLVEIIPQAEFNHGGTRNRGVALAGPADVYVFLTQDALPADDGFLRNLIEPILTGNADAAFARQEPYPDAWPPEVFARRFNYSDTSHVRTASDIERLGLRAFFFSNVASAVSAAMFAHVGGFPDNVIMNEDMVLCARVLRSGGRVAYVADARVLHSHNYTLKQQFRRYFDIGAFLSQSTEVGGGAGGHGLRFALGQIRWCTTHGALRWVPRCIIEVGLKWLAFQLGKRQRRLPLALKRRLSMHAFHWR